MRTACWKALTTTLLASLPLWGNAQTLLNLDFGVGPASPKTGLGATGMGTNDFWNLYRHYDPKFTPGMPLVFHGKLDQLKYADRTESPVSVTVDNAPGVWGNSSGDPMYDSYIFSQNGSNIVVTLTGLPAGRYHFYLYGHADADVSGEQNSVFTLRTGTNTFGPVSPLGGSGWRAGQPWREQAQYVVLRDVPVAQEPVVIEVAPGPNGVAVLNGLQVISRGTSPPRLLALASAQAAPASTNLLFREIRYDGEVSDTEARFAVAFTVESMATNEISAPLFEGDVALLSPQLPEALRIVSQGRQTRLLCTQPGSYPVKLNLVAKITKAEPWNQISFAGPEAAIASVNAKAAAADVEIQLLSGTQLAPEKPGASRVSGFLGADRMLSLRWQSKTAEVARRSLVTVDTVAEAQVTPTVVKFTTALRCEILQAAVPRLSIALPATHALTRIQGDQIRDWQVKPEGDHQRLTVEFIKPVEKSCTLKLFSEQTLDTTPLLATLMPPQPLEVERESGSFTLSADDTTVEIDSAPGLRQVNAPAGALAAYRFNTRPISVAARLQRIQPVLKLADRITARLEESRLLVAHALNLSVEKAGIYALELSPQPGFVVSEVRGEGLDDWKLTDGKLRLSFAARVLGARKLDIQLEQAFKDFPDKVTLLPLKVAGATNITTHLGAASAPGIRLKTASLAELREVPVSSLPNRSDELLAFVSEQPEWQAVLAAEKLPARVVAEAFNLVTVGDGLVGGSATIRYGIINQGVQQFRLSVPAHWKNVEFTGANIRRKELTTTSGASNVWTITLQDKAWAGYTLVLTYDYQFEPKGSTLNLAGAHPLDVERETGSLGVMTAASLKLTPAAPVEPLRRVDEAELSESDRALCTRPLLLAYQYTGSDYHHSAQVARFEELPVLEAVADRIELTTVLTEDGQLLTQSSFMVKNNEKQFQKFKLPAGAEFWSSYVNNQPAKPERDGDWLLVPLPRDANRDQAFAVDIVYAQKADLKSSLFPRRLELAAPQTDIPSTYAEWQLFAPVSQRLGRFDGNMTVARGTTYDLRDAWHGFAEFYGDLIDHHMDAILFCFVVGLVVVLLAAAARHGFKGAVQVVVVFGILFILAAMLLPALSKAKARAQRISAANNLSQIGKAVRMWSMDNGDTFPPNYEAMKNELGTDKVTIDPNTGQRFIYVGAGKSEATPEAIVAYSPSDQHGRAVLFADGSVQILSAEKFQIALARDNALPRAPVAVNQQATVQTVTAADATAAVEAERVARRAEPAPNGAVTLTPPAPPTEARVSALPTAQAAGAPTKPTATGVRPIRIDIPRTGQAFTFTKVLNAGQEPLTVRVSLLRLKVYRTYQMVLQVCTFVLGLLMLGWLALNPERSSFWLAMAASLIIWSVTSLLLMWRLLHVGFIVSVPALLIALVSWGAYRLWRRRKAAAAARVPPPMPPSPEPGATPAAPATLAVLAFLALGALAFSARAEDAPAAVPTNALSLLSATYTGAVHDKVAQLEAVLQLSSPTTNQIVPLFGDDVAVAGFRAPGDVQLVREGRTLGVVLPARTNITLRFQLLAKIGGDITRRQLAFGLPPALSSRFSLLLDEAEADVDVPTAVSFQHSSDQQQTRVEAILGPSDRLELNWTPRVKRAAEIAATVFVQNAALVTLGGGVMNTRATLDYQVSQGELKQVRLQLPAGQRLLRVEGDSIRTWELKDDTLTVDLLKGVSPAYKLTVETEKLLDKLPATARVEIPHALDVKRETGLLALRGSEELSLTVEDAKELQRVDTEEFSSTQLPSAALLSAFRFLKTDFALTLRAEAVQAQVEAVVRNTVQLSAESARVFAQIDYTIKRAGVFSLRLALPAGYRLEGVAGTNISQWLERTEDGQRLLEVTLKERTSGAFTLNAALTQNYPEVPRTLPIVGVHPLGTQKLSGFITVSAEPGIAAKTEAFDGLTEIPAAIVTSDRNAGSTLAYKFIATAPGAQPAWKLTVSTEAVEPWVRAEIANTVTLTETLVSGRTLVKFDIANAPVKEFRLRIPAAFKNVEVTGAQIRRRDQTNGQWRVELQGKVRGDYFLTVTWELPRSSATNVVELTGVEALGVERETGFLALIARPPLQVAGKSTSELLTQLDVRDLPDWAGKPDPATVLAYRYVRPGYKLSVQARRFEEAEVLQTLIDTARLTTVVADDGQMMTEMALTVRNNGRQHLEVELPAGATVWSAFVAGEPVRPSKREGKLLLPLARDIASDAPLAVEVTYLNSDKFPKRRGTVALVSPKFDVPLKNAHWDLYLPQDYEYSQFEGSMGRLGDAAMPMVQVYSRSEYSVQQKVQEEQKLSELQTELSEAKSNLKVANLRQAVGNLSRAKLKGQTYNSWANGDQDLKAVEQDVRKAQGSNLIAAQNRYFYENAGRLGDALVNPASGQQVASDASGSPGTAQAGRALGFALNNDAEIARLQWDKLEKAQQVAVAKVAPLRVNLPVRGVHYSFAQVLQTEVRKPMTIRLLAENTKAPSWTTRGILLLLGFALLWLLMALFHRKPAPRY